MHYSTSFRCPDDASEIEWRCFLNSVETVFTVANLERAPRIEPQSWRPLREMDYDKQLTTREHCLYNDGMRRLAQKVANRRLEVYYIDWKLIFMQWNITTNNINSHRISIS